MEKQIAITLEISKSRQFRLTSWTDVDAVYGNTANVTYRWLDTPFTARYVKLVVMAPTNNPSTSSSIQATRIYEFELYAPQQPVFNAIADQAVNENDLLQFTVNATGPENLPLTYSASNLPSGASFNPVTKNFSWRPRYDQAGVYHFQFTVSNNGGQSVSKDVTITVIDVPPSQLIDKLTAYVHNLELSKGIDTSLTKAKLYNANVSLINGDAVTAIDQINAFINEVNALAGKQFTRGQADEADPAKQILLSM